MPYGQIRGRKPFERASKIAHAEIINNPVVKAFLEGCTLPAPPSAEDLRSRVETLPSAESAISTVIAIDGGLTETWVREEFPSASIAFVSFGPLMLRMEDLAELEEQPFIGPEDMQRLKNIERRSLAIPTRLIKPTGCASYAEGVRRTIHEFLSDKEHELNRALAWLMFRSWRDEVDREPWEIPKCPYPGCSGESIRFRHDDEFEKPCPRCGKPLFLADALRLHERIDEELGAGGILSYLLSALEQIQLVHLVRSLWDLKPEILREVLFVRDGPLAFFGMTAPLSRPMRDLVSFLAKQPGGPLLNLVGLEKSGPFVEHAALIERDLGARDVLVLGSDYIYKHIVPVGSGSTSFGRNTYYGSKVIFKGSAADTYVATVPTVGHKSAPGMSDLVNAADVLNATLTLRCSMYDNALLPVVLANRLVSLADVPSSEILAKFARKAVIGGKSD